jgi:hypothetical protein
MDASYNPAGTPAGTVVAGSASAVSWSAILAGAAVAAAASLVLFALAAGLDLASMSSGRGVSGGSMTLMAAVALIITQWVSACLGGYVAGRLRTRWIGTHTHEVFFRDTAHGLITWCVATVFMASGLATAAASFVGTPTHLRGPAGYEREHVSAYAESAYAEGPLPAEASEVDREGVLVVPEAITDPALGAGTRAAPLLSARTAVLDSAFQGRLDSVTPRSRSAELRSAEDTEATRRDAALSSILTALSMLVGAFIASVSAALGGRLRDLHP